MKTMRWFVALALVVCCAALSSAQVPDDGGVGITGGHHSTAITTLTQGGLSFTSCAGSSDPDCAAFGSTVQDVLGGYNQTGQAWSSLSVTVSGLGNLVGTDQLVGCELSAIAPIFTKSNCLAGIPITGNSVTIDFLQGPNGQGISCFDPAGSGETPVPGANAACLANAVINAASNSKNGTDLPYWNPLSIASPTAGCVTFPSFPPGSVCGPNSFVIGVGIEGAGGFFTGLQTEDLTASVAANGAPEPQTLLLVGVALLGMLLLFLKKQVMIG